MSAKGKGERKKGDKKKKNEGIAVGKTAERARAPTHLKWARGYSVFSAE